MSGPLSRRRLLAGSVPLLGMVALAACSAPAASPTAAPAKAAATTAAPAATKATFNRATVKLGNIEGVVSNSIWAVGKKKGFFDEFGIDFDAIGTKDDLTTFNALLANEVDFVDSGIEIPLAAIEKGGAVKLLGSLRPGLDFVVYSQKDINSLKELEGKSVGTASPGSFLEQLMLALFDAAGVDASKVNFVNIGMSAAVFQAVVAGKIAAGPGLVDYQASDDADRVKVLAESWKVLPNYVNWGMSASAKAIQEKSDALSRAMAGYIKSHRYILQPDSKTDYVKVAVDEYKAKPAAAELSWNFYNGNTVINPNGDLTSEQTDYMQKLAIKNGTQAKVVPFTQVVDASIVQKAVGLLKS